MMQNDHDPNAEFTEIQEKDARTRIKKSRTAPKPPKKITEKYLYNSGLAYLQRFPASTHHFRVVMGRKIHKSCRHHTEQDKDTCLSMLEKVTQQFIELGLLDDQAYLKGMVYSSRRKGLATQMIIQKLTIKGFDQNRIKQEIDQYDQDYVHDDNGEYMAALTLARRKRLGPYLPETMIDKKTPDKQMAALARAGFSYDIVKKIMETDYDTAIDLIG